METLNVILPVLLYVFAIILLIVLIILGIKLIQILNKVERVVDDIEEKVTALNELFYVIGKATGGISFIGDSIASFITSLISKLFKKRKEDEVE